MKNGLPLFYPLKKLDDDTKNPIYIYSIMFTCQFVGTREI